jgi:hypothetical protein
MKLPFSTWKQLVQHGPENWRWYQPFDIFFSNIINSERATIYRIIIYTRYPRKDKSSKTNYGRFIDFGYLHD